MASHPGDHKREGVQSRRQGRRHDPLSQGLVTCVIAMTAVGVALATTAATLDYDDFQSSATG